MDKNDQMMDNCLLFILNVFCFNGFVENPHCTNKNICNTPQNIIFICVAKHQDRFRRLFAFCVQRERVLTGTGLISQCQSSLARASSAGFCVFLKYWYKMNPAAHGVMPVKCLGVSHTFWKPAGAFEGCSLCGPKWDPAAILMCQTDTGRSDMYQFFCGVIQCMGAVMLHKVRKAPQEHHESGPFTCTQHYRTILDNV